MMKIPVTFRCASMACERYAKLFGTPQFCIDAAHAFGWRMVKPDVCGPLPLLACSSKCADDYWIQLADVALSVAFSRPRCHSN